MSNQLPPTGSAPGPRLRPVEEWDSVGRRDPDGNPMDSYDDFGYGDSDVDYDEYELSAGDRVRAFGGRVLIRLGWCVLAASLALGGAGIIGSMSHAPTSANRPELTYDADNALSVRLDAAVRGLALLNDDVQSLGDQTRKALSSLAQVNQVGLKAAWDAGSNDVNSIISRSAALSTQLSCKTWSTDVAAQLLKTYSPAMINRYDEVCRAVASVAPLSADWTALVDGTKTAMQVALDINAHDQVAGDALQLATKGQYPEALTQLQQAAASISDANSIATNMSKIADVSTLQDWLRRTKDVDDALGLLWQTMIDSKGVVTAKVTAALKNVNAAKDLLPDSNAVMTIALHEMAGGLTTNGISIETAKGTLASALAGLVGTAPGE
jgi:hypothetical protein